MQGSLFAGNGKPVGFERGFLTCSQCGVKSPVVDIPAHSMPEREWTGWVRIKVGWRIDCPVCDPPAKPVDPALAARPIPPVLRLAED